MGPRRIEFGKLKSRIHRQQSLHDKREVEPLFRVPRWSQIHELLTPVAGDSQLHLVLLELDYRVSKMVRIGFK